MMRAAVIAEPRVARVRAEAITEPAAGQVRVRVDGCGVCGSNLPVWEGQPWFQYPLTAGAPGHEGWGRIDATGDGVTGFSVGDRVAMMSERAFAEYDVTDATRVVPIPAVLEGQPCPAEAVGCAVNIFKRSGIGCGSTVAIVGVGFLGAVIAQLASHAGARVIALSRRSTGRQAALRCGAEAVASSGDGALGAVADFTGQVGCDVVIEAAGLQSSLDLSTSLTRERGRLVIAGYHQDGPRVVDMQTWNWRGLDVINAHERDPQAYVSAMREGLAMMADGTLHVTALCTHQIPLDHIGEAFELLRQRPAGFLKAVVCA